MDNILPEVIPEEESRSPVYLRGTQHGAAADISSVDLFTKASTAGCSEVSLACGSVDSVGGTGGKYFIFENVVESNCIHVAYASTNTNNNITFFFF